MIRAPLLRRSFLVAGIATALAACARKDDRCAFCGMKIDPTSAWRADLVASDGAVVHFDTPRCALLAWRSGKTAASTIRLQEFYDRTWKDGASLRFALGSDVLGPMGPDVIPVDPVRAAKFKVDHAATDMRSLDELTLAALEGASGAAKK